MLSKFLVKNTHTHSQSSVFQAFFHHQLYSECFNLEKNVALQESFQCTWLTPHPCCLKEGRYFFFPVSFSARLDAAALCSKNAHYCPLWEPAVLLCIEIAYLIGLSSAPDCEITLLKLTPSPRAPGASQVTAAALIDGQVSPLQTCLIFYFVFILVI